MKACTPDNIGEYTPGDLLAAVTMFDALYRADG